MRASQTIVAILLAGGTLINAYGTEPWSTTPLLSGPHQEQRLFRTAVTRVEVSVVVLDRDGKPVRGLTAADFDVLEEGVPQLVRSFTPFTYDPGLLLLPDPVDRGDRKEAPASPVASNFYTTASRVFALILDDLHIDARRTEPARAMARRLLEQLAPTDLLFVTTTSASESTGFFTRDRTTARRLIDQMIGQRLLDKTLEAKRFPGNNVEAGRLDHYQRLCDSIRNVSLALRTVSGRRKTLILLSEGSSFGAGMSDMASQQYVQSGSSSIMQQALDAAAAGNVAIYPANPAGLGAGEADLIQGFGVVTGSILNDIQTEARQSSEMMRDFAALTGGVSLVDTNDRLGAIDRAVRDASSHYVLSYEPQSAVKGSEHRRIEVRVRRSGVRVLARRGYGGAGTKQIPPMKVPDSLSPRLRELLAGVVPEDGLPMRVQAVPVNRQGKMTSVAIVVEVNGAALTGERPDGVLQLEQGMLTMDAAGKVANGTRRNFDVSLTPVQREILATTGLRSVWAIDLPKGRHQVRVGSVHRTTGLGGAVYLDVDVSDDKSLPLGVLIASRVLSVMPTVFADERLRPWITPIPTATRVFPQSDVLTVTVPDAATTPVIARLTDSAGHIMWEKAGAPVAGLPAVQFVVPLAGISTPLCDLTIESSRGRAHATLGVVPLR